ncbi:MAG: extracellular solute-binding protein [Treponema sp.]|jgi:putative aldouronate transport system substrate-binding protein|nr:extracellular solute-binding protein [Treponema sp.]
MKRLFIGFLILAAAAAVFAGGRQGAGGAAAAGKTARVGARGSLPLATTKPVLTVLIPGGLSDRTTDYAYDKNTLTKKVVDETGVQLQITATTGADAAERVNILLNTGDYPDLILNYGVDLDYYSSQGTIIALDPYDPLSFPNIKRVFEEAPYAMDKITASDGKMYAMPQVNECMHCTYSDGRIWFYMPWARDSGRKAPQTLDEFTDYLRYVTNNDVNGNGRRDEIGIAFTAGDTNNFITKIAKAFMPYVGGGLVLENKRVVEQYRDSRFRDALRYIAGLYKEGLISEDSFSMTGDQLAAIARGPEAVAGVIGQTWINISVSQESQRLLEYFVVPPLKGPAGQQWTTNSSLWSNASPAFLVTDKCKDPELALALYDYFNNPNSEFVLSAGWGAKGISWTAADPGAVGVDGEPATWKLLLPWGTQPVNTNWHNLYFYLISQKNLRNREQVTGINRTNEYQKTWNAALVPELLNLMPTYNSDMWYNSSAETAPWDIPSDMFIPPAIMNGADNQRLADINAVLEPFKSQAWVEFITGVRDINRDADWNAYITELDRLGSPEMVSITQKYIK